MLEFDPDVYWNGRAEVCGDFTNTPKHRLHYNHMVDWLIGKVQDIKPQTLLDFGCGTGGMFRCWSGVPDVFAYDRSVVMLHKARVLNRQKEYGYKLPSPDSADRAATPFDDGMFDCVAMVCVLAHLKPEDFSKFGEELRRISKIPCRWLVVTNSIPHCAHLTYAWNHNIDALFGPDCKVLDRYTFEPYEYIEVEYGRGAVAREKGGTAAIQRHEALRGPDEVGCGESGSPASEPCASRAPVT